ncbi:MAG: GAF domain-containing protein [Crocinitomicaceae bacterium]
MSIFGQIASELAMIDTSTSTQSIDLSNQGAWRIVRAEPHKTLEIAKKNYAQAKEIDYKKGVAWALGNIGAAYTWMSEYEEALDHCFQSVNLLKELGEIKQAAQIEYYISIVFYFLGDTEKEMLHAEASYDLAKSIHDIQGMANAINGIGSSLYTNGKNEEAIEKLEEGLALALKVDDKTLLGRIYDGLGQANFHLKNYEEALKFKHSALEMVQESGVKQIESYAHDGIGEIYTQLDNYPKALEHFKMSYALRKEMGFKEGMGATKIHIAENYSAAGDNLSAVQHFKEALKIGTDLNSKELIYKAHHGLSELYEDMGNLTLFAKHFKAYHTAKQEFVSEKESKKIKAFELKGRIEQIQKEKEALEKKNLALESYFKDVQTLSSIGHEITSTLDIESIFTIIYERINSLMDATGVFIGVCNYQENKLQVKLAIDQGKRDDYFEYSLDEKRLVNQVIKTSDSVHMDDYEKEIFTYFKEGEELMHSQPSSVIIIPLKVKQIVIGVLYAQSVKKSAFSEHHFNILKSFASYISIALDNAWLYEQMDAKVRDRTEELEMSYKNSELLNKIGQELISTLNFEDVFERLYINVNKLMDATIFGVRLLDKENNRVQYLYEYERGKRLGEINVSMDQDNNYSVWCIKNNDEIFINDNSTEFKKYVEEVMVVDGDFPYSLIFVPLIDGKEVLGAISVQSFKKKAYSPYHLTIVRTLAQYTVIALQNARRYEVMEEEVKKRTSEIVKTYENTKLLSEIGKEIASELSSEDIILKVYSSINSMMDASIFGIGVYRKEKEDLFFAGAMEDGVKLDDFSYAVNADKLAAKCFTSSEEFVINDWSQEYHKFVSSNYEAAQGAMPESAVYFPLISKGNRIGVLTVQSFKKQVYEDYHVNMLRTLSLYVASALENASLYKEMEDRVKERTREIKKAYEDTKLLGHISRTIVESLEVESIIESVYESINTLLDATCFGIGIYDRQSNRLLMPGFIENGKHLDNVYMDLADENRLATICFKEKREVLVSNYMEEYKLFFKDIQSPIQGKDATSIIYLPLSTKDRVIGVLTVQSYKENVYSEYHLNLLRSLATTIATAIDNAILYESLEEKVNERTQELFQQKEIIEEKNKHITDSIRYAKRIQDATLPSVGLVRSYLPDSFVLFKPKDIVSGDFYWVEHVNDTVLFAVVDCTGHGVPGAFLSLIGHNSLNQIVNELGVLKPADILYELDQIVYKTLQNNLEQTNIKDGMDMAICSLNLKNRRLEFAGAYNPLYLIRNGELQEVKGDKIAIGMGQKELSYNNAELQLEPEDRIYLFSDGYADQFGGPKGKKFKYSQFKELLINIHQKPMEKQHQLLNHYIDAWQGDLEQIDDVCVIGVRI